MRQWRLLNLRYQSWRRLLHSPAPVAMVGVRSVFWGYVIGSAALFLFALQYVSWKPVRGPQNCKSHTIQAAFSPSAQSERVKAVRLRETRNSAPPNLYTLEPSIAQQCVTRPTLLSVGRVTHYSTVAPTATVHYVPCTQFRSLCFVQTCPPNQRCEKIKMSYTNFFNFCR